MTNFNIEQFLDLTDYATEERQARRKGKKGTQEFFTPYSIIKKMCDKIDEETWRDPKKTFLEPAAGNGQFVCYIIWKRLMSGVDWKTALRTLFALELMENNVLEMKERAIKLLKELDVEDFDEAFAREIMEHNFVCGDFFKWDFEHWRPIKEKAKEIQSKNNLII